MLTINICIVTKQNVFTMVLDILKLIYFFYLPVFLLFGPFITRVLSFVLKVEDGTSFAEEQNVQYLKVCTNIVEK